MKNEGKRKNNFDNKKIYSKILIRKNNQKEKKQLKIWQMLFAHNEWANKYSNNLY